MRANKKPIDKLVEAATYEKLTKKEQDLLLVYEDKTIILFGDPKKKNGNIKKI